MENRCVMCGAIIPEGLLVCPICTKNALTEERRKKTMSINWKRKLSSRKFWAALADFVSMIMIAVKCTENAAAQVAAIIIGGGGLIAYIIAEGLVDAENAAYMDAAEENKPPSDGQ